MRNETITRSSSAPPDVQVLRHQQVCEKLQVSSAKLFAMCAEGVFPKPFTIVPGGRAVGWLASDVDAWILSRRQAGRREELS